MTNGEALCWGDGHYGQLGNNRWINSNIPVRVQLENTSPLTGVSQVGLGLPTHAPWWAAACNVGEPNKPGNWAEARWTTCTRLPARF